MSSTVSLARVSWWRAKFWGTIFGIFSNGITTFEFGSNDSKPLSRKIKLPEGPLVVVANHSSHVDAVALVSAIGRVRPVLIVSAKDYWAQDSTVSVISERLVGTWPISRLGDGFDDLMRAREAVLNGTVLVVFPEGTRSDDGSLQKFHTGAFRFAANIGARILPIAVIGSAQILPRGASWPKRRALNLRIGEPIGVSQNHVAPSVELARAQIEKLMAEPVLDLPQFGWRRISAITSTWWGLAILFFWAFGEGIVWPLIAEMPLMLLIVTVGWHWRGLALLLASSIGSALGIVVTWYLVSHGVNPPSPFTTDQMFSVARAQLEQDGSAAFWHQMFNGIPVKVYAHEAGAIQMPFSELLTTLVPRMLRILIVGTGTWLFGASLSRWLKSCLGMVQLITLSLFPLGLALTVGYWS